MNRAAKADHATYQKINTFYAFKYKTDAKIIDHVRTWYGMKFDKAHMLRLAQNGCRGLKKEYYEKLYKFIDNLSESEMKDINKYWARLDNRLLQYE